MVDPVVAAAAVVVAVHVAVFAAVPALDPDRRRALRRRLGVAVGPVAAAWTLALLACVAAGAVLGPPFDPDWSRGTVRATYLYGFALVGGVAVGTTGLATAVLLVVRSRRIESAPRRPPGEVALSGRARPARGDSGGDEGAVATTPLFERPALCWSWSAAVERRDNAVAKALGTDTKTVASDTGGTTLQVETDAGTVEVDPECAALELEYDASTRRAYGATPPGRLTEGDLGSFGVTMGPPGETTVENVYREGHVTAGDAVTVVGRVDGAGRLGDGGRLIGRDAETLVATLGSRARRYGASGAVLLVVAGTLYCRWLGL